MKAILLLLCSVCGFMGFADDAVSPAFTFDARYQASGLTPDAWVSYQAEGLSSRFSAATVTQAADANHNGIPDEWEAQYNLIGANAAADADPDSDGRTNLEEYNAGTNPIIANDWAKSISESNEAFETDTRILYIGGNPMFDTTFAVIRVSNGFICDTGGLYYDWDGDGIPNWWEARYSRSGGKTGLVASQDEDHDGMSNYDEFVAYTDPTNKMSRFVIGIGQIAVVPTRQKAFRSLKLLAASPTTETKAFALRWQSAKGRTYSVFSTDNLAMGWSDDADAEIAGTDDIVEYVPLQNGSMKFFKVTVRLSDEY